MPDFLKIVFTFLLLPVAGCGYCFGNRLTEDIETVEVPIFGNATLVRGLEFDLSRILAEELKSRTSANVVTSGADSVLSGEVVEYEKVPVYEQAGEVIAGRIRIDVFFKLAADMSEEPLRDGKVSETQDFDLRAGVSEEEALKKTLREIARKIVYYIEDW